MDGCWSIYEDRAILLKTLSKICLQDWDVSHSVSLDNEGMRMSAIPIITTNHCLWSGYILWPVPFKLRQSCKLKVEIYVNHSKGSNSKLFYIMCYNCFKCSFQKSTFLHFSFQFPINFGNLHGLILQSSELEKMGNLCSRKNVTCML